MRLLLSFVISLLVERTHCLFCFLIFFCSSNEQQQVNEEKKNFLFEYFDIVTRRKDLLKGKNATLMLFIHS